jgi:ABC-2 type transport system ATP-binding protein
VDPKARRDFWDELHRMCEQGMTVLVSTHYMDEAERCHQLGYIAYGNLLALGTARELLASHGEPNLESLFVHLMRGAQDVFQ